MRFRTLALALVTLGVFLLAGACQQGPKKRTLLNVSFDPTRDFYMDFNKEFAAQWKAKTGEPIAVRQSHGGSGKQARSVIDGLEADVVTLALQLDIDAISERSKAIPADWSTRLPHNSVPYSSIIVFLVRKGNPKGIRDWGDLARPGVEVITPNPKTGGGARWNYLAAWAWADKEFQGDIPKIEQYVTALLKNVPVLDSGARGSTTTFAQRGIGDVLISWENETFLAKREFAADHFEVIYPSLTIRAETPVALVDVIVDRKGTRDLATAYLEALFSPWAQALAAKHYFRPAEPEHAKPEDLKDFRQIPTVLIDEKFGGWKAAQKKHFGDGGTFDRLKGLK